MFILQDLPLLMVREEQLGKFQSKLQNTGIKYPIETFHNPSNIPGRVVSKPFIKLNLWRTHAG